MIKTDAIVTAGGTLRPDSELLKATGIEKKALIPIAGKPMIGWVIDAVRGSGQVNHIIVVGLNPEDLNYNDDMLHFIESTGNLVDNVFAGVHCFGICHRVSPWCKQEPPVYSFQLP